MKQEKYEVIHYDRNMKPIDIQSEDCKKKIKMVVARIIFQELGV